MDPLQTITLVVKAPNQKIDDQTIECLAGWTVRKLKNHLANVYPNKPPEKDQKIIYSGKLLHDHLTLKDILRQYEESNLHTVHLVCAPCVNGSGTMNGNGNGFDGRGGPSNHNTSAMGENGNGTNLRHRNVGNPRSNETQQHPHQPQRPQQPFNPYLLNMMMQFQQHQMQQQQQQTGQGGMPNYMMQYQQQQAMWMQHMYMQQMSQYMQYMSQSGTGQMPETAVDELLANVAPPQPQQANENIRANNQPANQNVRMNAGVGGPPIDDDDEEEMNRDWLDYVYMLCRFGLLLSIVYFYSSIDRFLLVMGFVALMYLYQGGWFRVRRRQNRRNVPANAQEPAQPPPPQGEQPPTESPDEAQPSEDQETEPDSDNVATEQAGNAENDNANQEPQPGVMETAWNFVSSFFTSLIPQGPPEFPN